MISHFRGIVYPKPQGKLYRYLVAGLLVSDKPIPEFEGRNEILLDGFDGGLSDILPAIREGKLREGVRLGTVDSVLTNLNYVFDDGEVEAPAKKKKPKPPAIVKVRDGAVSFPKRKKNV